MPDCITSWAKELALFEDNIIACTLAEEEMAKEFYKDSTRVEGVPFTAWSEKWVYFPICFDGYEWVERAPRNVCDHSCEHFGGS